ncbi:MAG: lysylphosphatidylglycerol synthase transmembrane domain-containing protein [Bacteroidota bacterium]
MNSSLKTILKYLISVLIMVVFLYFSFRGTDFRNLWIILSGANYWWVVALLPVLIISHLLRAWRWKYLMEPIKRDLSFRNLWSALIIGYMLNNVLPKVGEIVRPYAIGKLEHVSRSAAFGTVIVERIFDIISFMIFIILIPAVYNGPLTQSFPWLENVGIWITLCTFLLFGILIFLMLRRDVVIKLLRYFTNHLHPARAERFERITHSFLDGFLFLKDTHNYFMIGVLSILVWALYILMMYLPFYGFGMIQNYSLDWRAAFVVQGISSIGIIIPTPGATGPYHYFVIQTLTKLYGVNDDIARSYAASTHAVALLGTTLIGVYYFFKDKIHLKDVSNPAEAEVNNVTEAA